MQINLLIAQIKSRFLASTNVKRTLGLLYWNTVGVSLEDCVSLQEINTALSTTYYMSSKSDYKSNILICDYKSNTLICYIENMERMTG